MENDHFNPYTFYSIVLKPSRILKTIYVSLHYNSNEYCWGLAGSRTSLFPCSPTIVISFQAWALAVSSQEQSGFMMTCSWQQVCMSMFLLFSHDLQLSGSFFVHQHGICLWKFISASRELTRSCGWYGAAEALASQIRPEHLERRQLFPSFKEIREISAVIGAAVAAKAYQLGTIPVTFS